MYNKIVNLIIKNLNKDSLLRRCLIVDVLSFDTISSYENLTNNTAICMKNFNEYEYQQDINFNVPILKSKISYSKELLNNNNIDDLVKIISNSFLDIENKMLEKLLIESIKLNNYDNIFDKSEDVINKIKNKINIIDKEVDIEFYFGNLITPLTKENVDYLFNKLGAFSPFREVTFENIFVGFVGSLNIYKCNNIKDIYVLCYPEYVGVMPIKKDISFIDKGDEIEFYHEFGAGIVYTNLIFKIEERINL